MTNNNHNNLKPWKPGQSGNPSGRKVGSKNMSTIVRELLEQEVNEKLLSKSNLGDLVIGKPTSYAQAIAMAMLIKALEGNVQAVCWLTEQQHRNYESESRNEGLFQATKIEVQIVPSKSSAMDL